MLLNRFLRSFADFPLPWYVKAPVLDFYPIAFPAIALVALALGIGAAILLHRRAIYFRVKRWVKLSFLATFLVLYEGFKLFSAPLATTELTILLGAALLIFAGAGYMLGVVYNRYEYFFPYFFFGAFLLLIAVVALFAMPEFKLGRHWSRKEFVENFRAVHGRDPAPDEKAAFWKTTLGTTKPSAESRDRFWQDSE